MRIQGDSSSPTSRLSPPTRESPPVQMLTAANASDAAAASRNDPIRRPTTPKCAPLATGLFVPVRGPNKPIGASINPPAADPARMAGQRTPPAGRAARSSASIQFRSVARRDVEQLADVPTRAQLGLTVVITQPVLVEADRASARLLIGLPSAGMAPVSLLDQEPLPDPGRFTLFARS